MISRPFIDRPVLATVLSLGIVLVGAISINLLPVEQYPDITPPTITVSATFPGADAATVVESVAAPIEQEINGAPNMIYMGSESSSNGNYTLRVTFEVGTDLDIAAIEIQDRVKQAESRLPGEVVQEGIGVSKQANALVQIFAVVSENNRYDETYIYNYTDINVREALRRIPGVGRVSAYGTRPYSMRVWLNPLKLAALGLTVGEVRSAIREQNTPSSGGTIGSQIGDDDVDLVFPVLAVGRLSSAEEFGDIIVHVESDGAMVRLRDVARIELASSTYSVNSRLDGADATVMAIYLLPGANMLHVADEVTRTLDELSTRFPDGLEYVMVHDSSEFVRQSISEVKNSLFQATLLVIAVVFLFLKRLRSTIIPAIAVPISLIGTFAAMVMLGFSINTFTLLALVLGNRDRCRRCDRRRRKRRATDGRRGTQPLRRHGQGDGATGRRSCRHDDGPRRGLRAGLPDGRHHRPALPPVWADDFSFRGHLDNRGAYPEPRDERRGAAPAQRFWRRLAGVR